MAKDHFIPASLIGRFSGETEGSPRSRKVWTLRRNGSISLNRSDKVGYSNKLYDVDEDMFPTRGVRAVDDLWGSYEGGLSDALDRLIDGSVSARQWIDTLVPFVAASFARDRGYKMRVSGRMEGSESTGAFSADPEIAAAVLDDTNVALNRLIEMERFAGRALASEWCVHRLEADVVLPDIGYSFDIVSEDPDIFGTYFPIGPRHILMLIPRANGRVLQFSDGRWVPCINHCDNSINVSDLNSQIAKTAQDFVVGAEEAVRQIATATFGFFDWNQIDDALSLWPFSVESRELSGLHRVIQSVIVKNLSSVAGMMLDPYAVLRELEPAAMFIAPNRQVPAELFLTIDPEGLQLRVHDL